MIDLTKINEVYLYTGTTDFRMGIYGLTKLISEQFSNSHYNTLFVFCSKNKKALKVLEFDSTGIWLYLKKVNTGKLVYPDQGGIGKISTNDLNILINGLEFVYKIEGKTNIKYDEY